MSRSSLVRFLAGVVCSLVVVSAMCSLPAQGKRRVGKASKSFDAAHDPYTGGVPARLRKLGYVSFGPFDWDGTHDTDALRRVLGEPRVLFVETAHFKIASALAPRLCPGKSDLRRKFAADLKVMRSRLPGIKRRLRKLDRWLLLHLYAWRMERLYEEFAADLGVAEDEFPREGRVGTSGHYQGEGQYLGQRAKFHVILFDRRDQLARYLHGFAGIDSKPVLTRRYEFSRIGSLGVATASECHDGLLFGDAHLHAHLICEVVKNLSTGYKSNLIELPTWWTEGLGHWYRRRFEPTINLLDEVVDPGQQKRDGWRWDKRVRARVRHEHYGSTELLFDQHDMTKWVAQEHMMAWSRVDFLLRKDRAGMRRFLDYLNDLLAPIRSANGPRQRKYQIGAMQQGWGLSFDQFDAEWKKFVLARYPR